MSPKYDEGEIFQAEIQRVSRSGNAIARGLNLGAIDAEPGEFVEVVYIGGEYGVSIDHIEEGRYPHEHPTIVPIDHSNPGTLSVGDELTLNIQNHSGDLGQPFGHEDGYRIHLPAKTGGHSYASNTSTEEVRVTFILGKFALAEIVYGQTSNVNDDTEAAAEGDDGEAVTGSANTGESIGNRPVRIGQSDFRDLVRDRYGDECILCDVSEPELLQAGHILDWSEHKGHRGEPGNGLLLCYTHHRAFDLNIFTIDESFELVVRPDFKTESKFLKRTIVDQEGQLIEFGDNPPSQEYLQKHNERLPWWPPGNRS